MSNTTRLDLDEVTAHDYDLVVIGAGINGAAIAREAALQGTKTLLIDKGDFGGGTSSWSSRLMHGGLRYLEFMEFALVHESLRDREALFDIASHLVKPLPFVVPLYGHNHKPGWMMRVGMAMYDALSWNKSVPRHRKMNKKAMAVELGGLDTASLGGGLHYYDGQVEFAERLVVENVLDAARHGATVRNHTHAVALTTQGATVTGVELQDVMTGRSATVRAKVVVNAAGPWVDDVLVGSAPSMSRLIGGTKGTHAVVGPFPGAPTCAVYYEARSDNRAVLVIPWRGHFLIGTTDDRFDGDLDTVAATQEEIDYILAETNELIPGAGLNRDSVVMTYAGVRPLPFQEDGDTRAISRSHDIVDHGELEGLISVVGGKLTPHLSLAEETLTMVYRKMKLGKPTYHARNTPLPGAGPDPARSLRSAATDLGLSESLIDRLVDVYGSRVDELLELTRSEPELAEVAGHGRGAFLAAEVLLAVREEYAVTLGDILHRRMMLGIEPGVQDGTAEAVGRILEQHAGWSADQVARDIRENQQYVKRLTSCARRTVSAGSENETAYSTTGS
ncbi:FAD dependent oxidoreductase [Rhodococcus sp. AW25M09]|uniref:glycerol-3-phosphate dehydrogenase n=1 Tax=Rhodococcus sp. AW25M09 TaxID=1268303 RepID=UPI0002ACE5CF|nr:glycerol-3-phosphate dehydrogenase [Rhodococcus sp. AW25M09]CCQ17836.1 FAD dependent oxidoreductase [Rhodococcus sp. AW25M09]